MANVTYANPFGAYTEGQSRGLEDALRAGSGARQFRDYDINAEFMKWYQPLRKQEAETAASRGQTELGKEQLGLNEGLTNYTSRLAPLGPEGRQAFYDQLHHQGYDVSDQNFPNTEQALTRIGIAGGNYPYQYISPNVVTAGPHGTVRDITSLYGPQGGAAAGAGQPAFNPFELATQNIFGQATQQQAPPQGQPAQAGGQVSPEEAEFNKTMGNLNNPLNPESPLYNKGVQPQQPKSIWADERAQQQQAGQGGGVNTGNGPAAYLRSATGGF